MLDIRLAQSGDAQTIHVLLQELWGESLLFDVFTDHISSPEHQVFVAVDAGDVVGFLSTFLVSIPLPRWEIDLIIVQPECQRKGIGASLIQEALIFVKNLGAHKVKASIRVDNYASQHVFAKTGFTIDTNPHSLLVWDPIACESSTNLVSNVHLIPVNTLTYRGLWIDGFVKSQLSVNEQHTVIRAAQNRIFRENRLNTGMFIRDSSKQLIAPDLLASATDYGQFHNWDYIFK